MNANCMNIEHAFRMQTASMTILTPCGGLTIDRTRVISDDFNVSKALTDDSRAGSATASFS